MLGVPVHRLMGSTLADTRVFHALDRCGLATYSRSLTFQLTAACVGATLGWTSFVVIYNQDFLLPTKQQTWSLLMSLVVTVLWELHNRVLVRLI